MLIKILLGVAIGATAGALLGNTRSCETGGCPLTANPYRGAAVGGFLGLMLALSFAQGRGSAPVGTDGAKTPPALIKITSDEQWKQAQASLPDKALAVFHAEWCGACKKYAPVVWAVASKVEGQAKVFYVDVDAAPGAGRSYGVEYLPTTVVLLKGKDPQTFVGVAAEQQLLDALGASPAPVHETGAAEAAPSGASGSRD